MAASRIRRSTVARVVLALAAGVAVAVVVAPFLGVAAGALAGWAAACVTGTTWVLTVVWGMDAAQTREHATAEDPGRTVARSVALIGSIASLGAVAVVLLQTKGASELDSFLLAGIAVVSVAASWALIQVDYMLRVAAVYYRPPIGGIDFNQSENPMYSDFVYVSVGLAMTYQVADTDVQTNELRRILIAQALLAYLFGAVILATVINLVTGLG